MQFVTEDILLRYRCNKGEHYLRFQHHVSPASSSLAGLFRGAFIPSQKRMEKGNDIYENDSADYDRWLALVARLRLGWFFVFCVAAPTDCQVLVRSSDYFDLNMRNALVCRTKKEEFTSCGHITLAQQFFNLLVHESAGLMSPYEKHRSQNKGAARLGPP